LVPFSLAAQVVPETPLNRGPDGTQTLRL
jgi:hypothetical protein